MKQSEDEKQNPEKSISPQPFVYLWKLCSRSTADSSAKRLKIGPSTLTHFPGFLQSPSIPRFTLRQEEKKALGNEMLTWRVVRGRSRKRKCAVLSASQRISMSRLSAQNIVIALSALRNFSEPTNSAAE